MILAAWGISHVRPGTTILGNSTLSLRQGSVTMRRVDRIYYDPSTKLWHAELTGPPATTEVRLWLALVVAASPTLLLFWRDRRRIPEGHCQECGYDLTGNVSGVCSECGEFTGPKSFATQRRTP